MEDKAENEKHQPPQRTVGSKAKLTEKKNKDDHVEPKIAKTEANAKMLEKSLKQPPSSSGIANFFSKQAAKPLVEKKEVDKPAQDKKVEEVKEKISSDNSPGKENIVNQNIEKTKEEESKDKEPENEKESAKKKTNDKKPTKKKPTKSQDDNKKRKRIQVMSDSEEFGDEKEEPATAMEEVEAPPHAALIESDDDEKVYESRSETDNEPSPVKKQPVKTVERKKVKS